VEGLNGASSYGYAVAADTGSAIKNMKIDLYMDSHQEALNWGFKKVNVYIVED
jgi:3D (Asp-Asp-Asp) domain-containing protein